MAASSHDKGRIWLLPFSILAGVALSVFVLTHLVDASGSADPWRVLDLIIHPNPQAAASTLANAGEIVAAVLAIALTVVAIIVELASNRYTHRVTELFVSEPVNFAVMGLFVVTALQGVWVTMTFDYTPGAGGFVPYAGIGVSMGLLTLCLLVLIPYFNFVFAYLNPIRIVERISSHTLGGIAGQGRGDAAASQREAVRGVEQLADVALNAMQNRDKGVSMAAVDALADLMRDYQQGVGGLPDAWFRVEGELAHNPDFVSMDPAILAQIGERRIWFEMKILRQYQMVYGEALNRMRDINYLIAINTRLLAEDAAAERRREQLHLLMKFFNTYLRAAINAKDVRTLYNVCHQYRMLAQALVEHRDGAYAVEIARYFKYYGLLAYNAHLPFILETVAYDLCTLCEYAHGKRKEVLDELLKILLAVDRTSEGSVQEASLRGVRKAQVKLATYFLAADDEGLARTIHEDMAGEDPQRMASIRDELFSIKSPEYWEVIDRGANFDYLEPERRATLQRFFGWFPELPTAQATLVSHIPAAPGEEAG
ncbi:MAG: DUF2254 domain-containing protein [Myxococcales bacterium]|nr:DUF2254 domain-containing protein [Myxococcales bacterium]